VTASWLAIAALFAPGNPNPWQQVKNDDGMVVWAREVPGSSIREVKAETTVDVRAERVWEVLSDVAKYVEFMPYLVETRILGPAGERARYEYQLIDPPLVDRRDYTLRVSFEEQPETGVFRRAWTPANDKGPPAKDGVVRVAVCEGSWTVERKGAEQARVVYWLYTDPGGAIPNWVANRANATSVPDLLRAVRQRSLNPQWRRDN